MIDKESYYFDSFGGPLDKFLLENLSKLITFHHFKFQDLKSNLCRSYPLYIFYLIERMECVMLY